VLNRCGANNVLGTATSTYIWEISLTWDAVPNAVGYQLFRSANNGPYEHIASPSTNAFTDSGAAFSGLAANTAYLYRVIAVYGASDQGPASAIDLATTITFTDDPIVAGSTPVRAEHVTELRTAVNAVRAAKGLAPGSFTNPVVPGATIKALDVTELRSNLDTALTALGLRPPAYTDPALAPGDLIKAAHLQELRRGVK
jgi:hypothetical protein